ncbi:uncharacterized protein LOC114538207 isoform X2 [Dendronephthya gigantea]|uniref:uncharacterized protein LOC114538207 isoform X2 n=1 Tax=Dendronephthya gigantea TaxID=151771 RepID=UPI00106B02BF|nr:uncharacterized protein LOC114538207 isoform X2 [Dendronephthya gigantea]
MEICRMFIEMRYRSKSFPQLTLRRSHTVILYRDIFQAFLHFAGKYFSPGRSQYKAVGKILKVYATMSNNVDTVNALMQVVQMLHNRERSQQAQPSTSAVNNGQNGQTTSASSSTSTGEQAASTSATNSRHLEEHRRLFSRQARVQPYSRQIPGRRRRAPAKKEKCLTKTMFCFAERGATEAPSCSEKLELLENGLGEKRVSFPVSATAAAVKEVLFEAYPPLRFSGGFQILVSQEKERKKLKVVSHGSCSTEQLRCFGNGRIYIRPLQRSIPLTETVRFHEEKEICLSCGESVSVSEMSEHLQACEHYHSANEHETEEGDENSRYGINSERNDVVQVTDDDTLISNTTSLPLNEQIAPTQLVSNTDARDSDLDSLAPVPQPNETLEIEDSNRAELENSVEVDPMALPYVYWRVRTGSRWSSERVPRCNDPRDKRPFICGWRRYLYLTPRCCRRDSQILLWSWSCIWLQHVTRRTATVFYARRITDQTFWCSCRTTERRRRTTSQRLFEIWISRAHQGKTIDALPITKNSIPSVDVSENRKDFGAKIFRAGFQQEDEREQGIQAFFELRQRGCCWEARKCIARRCLKIRHWFRG